MILMVNLFFYSLDRKRYSKYTVIPSIVNHDEAKYANWVKRDFYKPNDLYDRHSEVRVLSNDEIYVTMDCYRRTMDEWDNDFDNNPKEYPIGSKEYENRLKHYNNITSKYR